MAKRKIKTRKERMTEYNATMSDIPKNDPVERIMYCIGDKLSEKRVRDIIARKEKIVSTLTTSTIALTFYEDPINSERPRSRLMGGFISTYVPNAKSNKDYIKTFLSKLKKDINLVHTPIFIELEFYHKMPNTAPIEEQVLFEAKILNPITKPDWDNVSKSYTDNLIELLILDDDLIYKAHVEKFFSFLPRVEMKIHFQDQFASKFLHKKIINRKSYKKLKDHIILSEII